MARYTIKNTSNNDKKRVANSQFRSKDKLNFFDTVSSDDPSRLYNTMRLARKHNAFIDTTINKRVSFIGDFELSCDNESVLEEMNHLKETIPVSNTFFKGFDKFQDMAYDSFFWYGASLGEAVPNTIENDWFMLNIESPKKIDFYKKNGFWDMAYNTGVGRCEFANKDLIYYMALNPKEGKPYGWPLFASLELPVEIMWRLENATRNTAARMADPTYSIVGKSSDSNDPQMAGAAEGSIGPAEAYQSKLGDVFKTKYEGHVGDAWIDIDTEDELTIEILGKEGVEMIKELEYPTSSQIEKLISVGGLKISDYALKGWNTNYNMTESQRIDKITMVERDRRAIEPTIKSFFGDWLLMKGYNVNWSYEWRPVNVGDADDKAKTRVLNSTALLKEIEAMFILLEAGLLTDDEVAENVSEISFGKIFNTSKMDKEFVNKFILDKFKTRKSKRLLNRIMNAKV